MPIAICKVAARRAALVTLDKDPQTLVEAVRHMESATTVTFDESFESSLEEPAVRVALRTPTSKPTNTIETRISTLEDQQKEHTRLLNGIITRLPEKEQQTKTKYPDIERKQYRSPSPPREESRRDCYKCGRIGHYARNCSRSKSTSPSLYTSPSRSLNFQQLEK